MVNANNNVRYVSAKDVKGKNATKKVYKVDPTKPHKQRSSGNYVSSSNSGQDYYFHLARRNPRKYLQNYKPNYSTKEYYGHLARTNPREYLKNYDPGGGQTREEWLAENQNQHKESRGLLSRIFGTMGYNGIVEGLYNLTDDDKSTTFSQGLVEGAKNWSPLTNDVSGYNTFSDVLRNLGWEDKPDGKPNVLRGIVGFAGDVLLDPLTYLNPFSSLGKVAKGTGMTLEMAKEMKALSKAASISDDIGKATKVGTSSGKLSRVLSLDEVGDYVKKQKPYLNEEELAAETQRLHTAYARKVQGLRDVDEGADFGIGLSGLPFSSKIKVGDKTLDKFQKSFMKASTLRNIGDNTIAPYYNSMMKRLKTTRAASLVSKNNQMLRTAKKSGVMDSFREFYLSDLQKGYQKAANNMEAISQAEELRKLFKDYTDDDYLKFIKDHEDGVHESKRLFEEARLKADEEFIKKTEMNKEKQAELLKSIREKKQRVQQMYDDIDELYTYLNSYEGKWEYRYATNTLNSVTMNYTEAVENFLKQKELGEKIGEAEELADEATEAFETATAGSRNKIDELQTKIDNNAELAESKFEDTLTPEELERYNNRQATLDEATTEYNSALADKSAVDELGRSYGDLIQRRDEMVADRENLIDEAFDRLEESGYRESNSTAPFAVNEGELISSGNFTFLNPTNANGVEEAQTWLQKILSTPYNLRGQVASDEALRIGLPQTDWADMFYRYNRNKETGEISRRTKIGIAQKGKISDSNGMPAIEIAAKRPLVDTLNELMPDMEFSVYGMNTELFDNILVDLVSGDYESFFANLGKYSARHDEILNRVDKSVRDDYFVKLEKRYKSGQIDEDLYNKLKDDPLGFMEDPEIRHYVNSIDRKSEKARDIEYARLNKAKQDAENTLDKTGRTNAENTAYENIYMNNISLIRPYGKQAYELFGKAPGQMSAQELRQFVDEMYYIAPVSFSDSPPLIFFNKNKENKYLVDREDIPSDIDWNRLMKFFNTNYKGKEYTQIMKKADELMSKKYTSSLGGRPQYDMKLSAIMKEFGNDITIEEAADLVSGRVNPAGFADKIMTKKANPVYLMKMILAREGYGVDSFKRVFLEMGHEDRMAILRSYNSDVYDEYGNFLKDVWDDTIQKLKEAEYTWTSSLDGLTDWQKDIAFRFYKKSWGKSLGNFPEDKIDKLNEVAQRIIREKALESEVPTATNKVDDAFNKVRQDLDSIRSHYKLDDDAEFETMLDDWAEIREMSTTDREWDFCDLMDSTNDYNTWILENVPENQIIEGYDDLVEINNAVLEETGRLRRMLLSEKKYSPAAINRQKEEILRLDNVRRNTIKAMTDSGTPLRIDPSLEKVRIAKQMQAEENVRQLSRRINLFDELKGLSEDDINELSRFRSLGSDEVDNINSFKNTEANQIRDVEESSTLELAEKIERYNDEIDDLNSAIADMEQKGANLNYMDDETVRLKKLRYEDEVSYNAEMEARKAEFKRQKRNARQNTRRWLKKIEDLTNEIQTAGKYKDEYVERYKALVKEGSEIPFVSPDDLSYLAGRMRQLTDFIKKHDEKTATVTKALNDIDDIKAVVAEENEELGNLMFADILSVSDKELADTLNISARQLKRIDELGNNALEVLMHEMIDQGMTEIAAREVAMGILSPTQVAAHGGGHTYIMHELTDYGKQIVGDIKGESKAGEFSPEHGPKKKQNKRRKFYTVEEGVGHLGKEAYVLNVPDLVLTRALRSNNAIHSVEVNNVIKDLCTPFTGSKASDHIVVSYIDVYNDLAKGFYELQDEALKSGAKFTGTLDEYVSDALKKAGIDEDMFSANYAYFDILPEQFDILKRNFHSKSDTIMYNMDKELYHKVNQFTKVQMDSIKSGFTKIFDKFQNGWKVANTVINPGFHIQNAISNAFTSFMAIGEDAFNPVKLRRSMNILRTKDPKQIVKLGGKEYTYKMLCDAAEQYKVLDNTFFNKDIYGHMDGVYNFLPLRIANSIGAGIEGNQRFHLFLSLIDQGKSFEEAAEGVDKFLFDYADLTRFEQTTLKRIIPFYTFMRKNLPLQFEMMIEQPQKYLNFQKAFREVGEMSPDGDYVEENERNPYRQGDIQLPFQINGRYYGIADQLPYSQLERILDPQKLIGQTSPWLKTPVEALTNTFLYTGQSITGDDGQLQGGDILNYLAQQVPYAKMIDNGNKKSGKGDTDAEKELDAETRKKLYILGQLAGFPVNSIDRMYWYDDYGNWAADYFDTPLPQQIQRNMDLRQ